VSGTDWGDSWVRLTPTVSVLVGANNGAYPAGNSLLVQGAAETALIDPSVTVVERGGAPVGIDAVINSHGHEDHVAGNGLFPHSRVHIHRDDLPAARSLAGMLDGYGFDPEATEAFARLVVDEFHYQPRPDARGFSDGHVFDLGGGVTIEAMHLPGHTIGHSGFVTTDVFFLSDIDLSGFGPYYGDAWSSLDQFEASLAKARAVDARWYVTFHHKGIIEGRTRFVEMIDAFAAVIDRRHREMLAFLAEPRTLQELVDHRFLYRPHVEGPYVDGAERRTASLHLERMLARGEAVEAEPGRFQRS
jgi:glyoxylase-like metal-dependent hydrolase (beta-lactamase superfamily II)